MKPVIVLMVIGLLLVFASGANAQIPRTISYQGVLADANGNPKADATYNITFRLYEALGGGTAIWTEPKSLQVKRGLFYTLLGNSVPFGAAVTFDKPYWVSIQVESDAELSPRVALASMPYTFNALNADTADYAVNIKDGAVTTAKISNGVVTGDKIADNTISSTKLTNEAGITTNQYLNGIVVPTTSTYVDIVSATITTPSSGVLMIFANGYWATDALASGNGYLRLGIQIPGLQPVASECQVYYRQNMQPYDAAGFSHHIVANVPSSGTYEFRLMAYSTYNVTFTVWYPRLTIVFYPTEY